MRQANLIFFNNDTKSIGKCEFTNMLKDDKYVSSRSLHAFIENIDEDKSLTITSQEFFDFMINKLKIIKHGGVMNYKTVEDEF
jgi:Ca2+-binding EF-hand superfamily protein